ncbi:MAG: hypothetical protein GF335_00835 [Candidatus Moranbacteria bacterium]|nr:hypothetical protein [Candidatus Moranbacteria bacterium]
MKFLKKFKNKIKKRKKSLIVISVFLLFAIGLFSIFIYNFVSYQQKVYPNVYSLGKNFGSLDKNQLQADLEDRIQFFEDKKIKLIKDNQIIESSLNEMGIEIDKKTIQKEALSFGKNKNVVLSAFVFLENLFLPNKVPTYFIVDDKKLNNFISKNLEDPQEAPQSAEVIYKKGSFVSTSDKKGLGIDSSIFAARIFEYINNPALEKVEVPDKIMKEPQITKEEANIARDKANKLIAINPKLTAGNKEWFIDKEVISNFIDFKKEFNIHYQKPKFGEFNKRNDVFSYNYYLLSGLTISDYFNGYQLKLDLSPERIRDYLMVVAPGIEQKPVNAVLGFENDQIVIKQESQDKVSLNVDQSVGLIQKGILEKKDQIDLEIIRENAPIAKGNLKEIGIETLIGRGESNFRGSPKNRKHNIAVGASKFNGIIIAPNEEFSFLDNLGAVDASTGYLPELVIKKDKTVPEYGGGMCQVSTTCFRGAVDAGFEITERRNHAYPVHYYSPQGTDATVYIPSPDLKFTNNTPSNVYLQTKIQGNELIFEYYGTDDGRRVETIGPVVYQRGAGGAMKTKWTQQVYKSDGSLLLEETFLSKYDSPSKYPHPGEEPKEEDDD